MSRSHLRRSKDLIATVAATVIAIVVALLVESGPLAVAALVPLVLVLPGYAITAVLFPAGTIDRGLRVALVVALSVAATALSGLVLQVFVDLSRGVVAVALAGITIAAALAALARRKPGTDERAPPASPRRCSSSRPAWHSSL